MELFRCFLIEDKDDAFLHELHCVSDLVGSDIRVCGRTGSGYFFEKVELPGEEVQHFAVETLVFLALFKHMSITYLGMGKG